MMMEPRRLLEDGATEAERALLDSARADGPRDGAAERMFVALQSVLPGGAAPGPERGGDLPPHGAAGAQGSMAAHAIKVGTMAKVGLLGLVGFGILGGGLMVQRLARPPSVASGPLVARAPARVEPSAETNRGSPAPEPSLSAEIRVLDIARAAVEARDAAAAERALDGYDRRFPQGHLRPEATVLRLAVLVQQGQHAEAKSLAARLLASPAYKTYQPRIRSLLREAQGGHRRE